MPKLIPPNIFFPACIGFVDDGGRQKHALSQSTTPFACTLSELFLEFPSRVRLETPKPNNSRHLNFQHSLPLSMAGNASFFRSGSGEGLSELVMAFSAALRVFLTRRIPWPPKLLQMNCFPEFICHFQAFVKGGFQTMLRALCGKTIPLPLSYLILTPLKGIVASSLPHVNLIITFLPQFNLCSVGNPEPLGNHGLQNHGIYVVPRFVICRWGYRTRNRKLIKATQKWLNNYFSGPRGKWLKNDSKFDSFPEKSHFGVTFGVTFPGPWKVTFESPKCHFWVRDLWPNGVSQI